MAQPLQGTPSPANYTAEGLDGACWFQTILSFQWHTVLTLFLGLKASHLKLRFMLDVMFCTNCSIFFTFFWSQIFAPVCLHLKPGSVFAWSLDFLQKELRLIIAHFSHINKLVHPAFGYFESAKHTESNTDPWIFQPVPFQLQWGTNAAMSLHSIHS